MNPYKRFKQIAQHIIEVGERHDFTWKQRYEMIFNPNVSGELWKLQVGFDYCDPDMDYSDDVRALVDALRNFLPTIEAVANFTPALDYALNG